MTHYPHNRSIAKKITKQESKKAILKSNNIHIPELAFDILEQIGFEARKSATFAISSGFATLFNETLEIVSFIIPQVFQERKIMIVEDNAVNMILLKQMLKNLGMKNIIGCNNGFEAIESYSEEQPTVIFMDVQMPGMDGYEATMKIRNLVNGADSRIIAVTANAMGDDKEKCIDAGMDDYLSKPFVKVQIYEKLMEYLP